MHHLNQRDPLRTATVLLGRAIPTLATRIDRCPAHRD